MIVDSFNRVHDYLRISVTDNCNLRCFYCMPEEDYHFTPTSRLMQADEIKSIAGIFVSQGIRKIRITGGEPLVRKDAGRIFELLSELNVNLTLTTNGTRLHDFADMLSGAGVRSLNISLDTLLPEKFQLLTKRDQFHQILANIRLMITKGFHVKVNVVVMKGINENELLDFVAWTKDEPVHVRFIEFMPFSGNHWNSDRVFTLHDMIEKISSKYEIERLDGKAEDTAKAFRIAGHQGSIAVISTMSAPFCNGCNRIRLTADGKIKNCLFSKDETDLLNPFRNGEDILPLIRQNIWSKKKELGGQFTTDFSHIHPEEIDNRSMITIGG